MVNKMVNKLRRELTLKQTAVLRAVEGFILEHGYAPTVRGLAAALRMANPSAGSSACCGSTEGQ
jgi:SOS-response transcriptional repressor LexA